MKADDDNESVLSERNTLVDLNYEINNFLNRSAIKNNIESSKTSQSMGKDTTEHFSSLNTI